LVDSERRQSDCSKNSLQGVPVALRARTTPIDLLLRLKAEEEVNASARSMTATSFPDLVAVSISGIPMSPAPTIIRYICCYWLR
jgi:hypothetical protein